MTTSDPSQPERQHQKGCPAAALRLRRSAELLRLWPDRRIAGRLHLKVHPGSTEPAQWRFRYSSRSCRRLTRQLDEHHGITRDQLPPSVLASRAEFVTG
jgi:hypothetical protein